MRRIMHRQCGLGKSINVPVGGDVSGVCCLVMFTMVKNILIVQPSVPVFLQVNDLGRENIRLRQQVQDLAETNKVLIESVPKLADKCK